MNFYIKFFDYFQLIYSYKLAVTTIDKGKF